MAGPGTAAGFVYGTVARTDDPEMTGRIKAFIGGLAEPETDEWLQPAGWPGAGGLLGRGSRYPVRIGDTVCIIFEHGDPAAGGIFLPGPYGTVDGAAQGPIANAGESTTDRANEVVTIWEDETFSVYITQHSDDKRLVIQDKNRGAHIEMNMTDGASGKAATLTIYAPTSLQLSSDGNIDIRGSNVQIQGRRVSPYKAGMI